MTHQRKVAIVGFSSDSRELAPYNSPEWEIWGINKLWSVNIPNFRWDRWFDIHDPSCWDEQHHYWLKTQRGNKPIYLQENHADIADSVRFPIEEVTQRFTPYHTNSISYMIALALIEGFDVIGLYGVDMESGGEYEVERPSVEYFLGVAEGMGKEIILPKESPLLRRGWLYGFEAPPKMLGVIESDLKRYKQQEKELLKGVKAVEAELEAQRHMLYQNRGNIEQCAHILNLFGVGVAS